LIVAILSFSVNSQITALATILFGLLIIQLAISKTWLVTFLSTRVILLLGGASYALYLAQGPIREWVRLLIPGKLLGSVVNPVVALLVAIAIFMYFERPFRRFVRDALMIRTKPPAQGTRPVKTNS
jgi:peptidoglycan/LPS O-acetylase OafA/YrhL